MVENTNFDLFGYAIWWLTLQKMIMGDIINSYDVSYLHIDKKFITFFRKHHLYLSFRVCVLNDECIRQFFPVRDKINLLAYETNQKIDLITNFLTSLLSFSLYERFEKNHAVRIRHQSFSSLIDGFASVIKILKIFHSVRNKSQQMKISIVNYFGEYLLM